MTIELTSPLPLLEGPAEGQATGDLVTYLSTYTGRFFEPLAGRSDPDRFEATDVVAVSCLSVNVPAETAGWILVGDGAEQCAELLVAMNVVPTATLWDHDLTTNTAAVALWELLRSRHQLGPTTVSKLLAAKRPHLFPIFDEFVADALLPAEHRAKWEWWGPWRNLLTGPDRDRLAAATQAVRARVAQTRPDLPVGNLSDLRLLDIVIWMTEDRRRRV